MSTISICLLQCKKIIKPSLFEFYVPKIISSALDWIGAVAENEEAGMRGGCMFYKSFAKNK